MQNQYTINHNKPAKPSELANNLANLRRLIDWTIDNLSTIEHDREAIEHALFDIAQHAIEAIPVTFEPETLADRYAATGALAMTILQAQHDLPAGDIVAAGKVLEHERELTRLVWK